MLWGKIKRSPHAHARILSIDTSAAEALPGVKAVVTAADFPEITSEEAFVGEGPMNFRDLSRNIMARDKALYEGHAVAAVAAVTQEIANQALDLIDVTYEVLPFVIDVEDAMAPDAPILHEDLFTAGIDPKPNAALQRRESRHFQKGRHRRRLQGSRCYRRRPLHHAAGASGLYRAARLPRDLRAGRPDHHPCLQPGSFHDPRLYGEVARHRHGEHPGEPGGDRRRLRRQDADLSGAGRGHAVEEWPASRSRSR